jgi:hypothetical protein
LLVLPQLCWDSEIKAFEGLLLLLPIHHGMIDAARRLLKFMLYLLIQRCSLPGRRPARLRQRDKHADRPFEQLSITCQQAVPAL